MKTAYTRVESLAAVFSFLAAEDFFLGARDRHSAVGAPPLCNRTRQEVKRKCSKIVDAEVVKFASCWIFAERQPLPSSFVMDLAGAGTQIVPRDSTVGRVSGDIIRC